MSNYDKCVNMLCLTGRMPANLIDAVCEEAHRQIYNALNSAQISNTREGRNNELFGERRSAKNDYTSAWFDLEEVLFAECGGFGE